MNIIVKCTLAACALLFSGVLSAEADCGYFNRCGEIVPYKRPVVEKCCCTKQPRPCPRPYCPPPRVICYTCPSCPEYAAYWSQQDAVMANDVNNVRGAPAATEVDKWERTGFNNDGRLMYRQDQMMNKDNAPSNDGSMNQGRMMNDEGRSNNMYNQGRNDEGRMNNMYNQGRMNNGLNNDFNNMNR